MPYEDKAHRQEKMEVKNTVNSVATIIVFFLIVCDHVTTYRLD